MMWSTDKLGTGRRKSGAILAFALAWVALLPPAGGDDEKGKDKDDEDAEVAEGGSSGVSAFGKFLPIGRPNEGVTIPSFDNGVRTSLVKAASMMRIDDDNLQLDDMVIEMFKPDGSPDSKITLLRALYHMPTSIMTSRSRSKVERPDFEIVGDGLVFDTESQRGRMAGNVEMVIFDVKAFGAEQGIASGEESEEGKAEPSPPGEGEANE